MHCVCVNCTRVPPCVYWIKIPFFNAQLWLFHCALLNRTQSNFEMSSGQERTDQNASSQRCAYLQWHSISLYGIIYISSYIAQPSLVTVLDFQSMTCEPCHFRVRSETALYMHIVMNLTKHRVKITRVRNQWNLTPPGCNSLIWLTKGQIELKPIHSPKRFKSLCRLRLNLRLDCCLHFLFLRGIGPWLDWQMDFHNCVIVV